MRHNIFRLLTEEQCKEFLRDKTAQEIKDMIYGFNKRVADEIKHSSEDSK